MVRNVIDALEPDRPQSTPALEPLVDLGRSRLEMVLKVLDVDGAVRRVKGGWVGTGQPWEYDEARYRKLDEARKREQQAMLDYQSHRRLPDGVPARPTRRSRTRPRASAAAAATTAPARAYDAEVDAAAAEDDPAAADAARGRARAAQAVADGLGKLGVDLSGRISDGPAPGRVIGRLTDLGWGARLRRLLDEPDARGVRRGGAGRGEGAGVVGLGDAADRGAGAGLGQPPAADRVAGRAARRAGPADRPRHAAVRAGAPAGDRGQLRVPRRRADGSWGRPTRRRSPRRAGRCCWSTT